MSRGIFFCLIHPIRVSTFHFIAGSAWLACLESCFEVGSMAVDMTAGRRKERAPAGVEAGVAAEGKRVEREGATAEENALLDMKSGEKLCLR